MPRRSASPKASTGTCSNWSFDASTGAASRARLEPFVIRMGTTFIAAVNASSPSVPFLASFNSSRAASASSFDSLERLRPPSRLSGSVAAAFAGPGAPAFGLALAAAAFARPARRCASSGFLHLIVSSFSASTLASTWTEPSSMLVIIWTTGSSSFFVFSAATTRFGSAFFAKPKDSFMTPRRAPPKGAAGRPAPSGKSAAWAAPLP
mmetsp:Transcript_41536/g.109613  ORF Transcript_41536/g.109613 Transcript_41536/m.109613 type:complete len:207 (-) Transcript_41536:12-632(-)